MTGDNEQITQHICNEIGVPVRGVLTGHELARMSEETLRARLSSVNLFCRVTPQQKERILLALKRVGSTVGFLGDGINDASALHAADVGISVDSARRLSRKRPPISCCWITTSAWCNRACSKGGARSRT